jgi:hypothetical protein
LVLGNEKVFSRYPFRAKRWISIGKASAICIAQILLMKQQFAITHSFTGDRKSLTDHQ